jgi:charged multivesicular body protein 6
MLAGRMSNEDEDEVEAELEDLEREVNGVADTESATPELNLPNAPSQEPPVLIPSQRERWKERAKQQRADGELVLEA